ncbi:MAG: FecR domain-containing protein [Acidobacteriota bacterium]|nr:FecR domain-containing protein [Acidobacteriota bacterium]
MNSRNWSRSVVTLCLAVAIVCVYSMVALAAQQKASGELSVVGEVSVNGSKAISGATVFTDSTITTGENSSAVVSLGKLGRVELMPNSSLKLSFAENNVSGTLDSGKVRFSTAAGVAASVMTKDGTAVASNNTPNIFVVDVSCGNTLVATQAGNVELRSGSNVKQIAAGNQDTAGTAQPGSRCTRLTRASTFGHLSGGALALLLLGIGGAIAAALLAQRSDNNEFNFGGTPIVISPSR